MHSRKCNEVLVDDIGDIAESSGEEEPESRGTEQEIGPSSNILQSNKDGASVLLPNSFLSETVSSQLASVDKQASSRGFLVCSEKIPSSNLSDEVGGSILSRPSGNLPSDNASSQLPSDNQTAADSPGFLKTSEASLLQKCLERSEETRLTAPS